MDTNKIADLFALIERTLSEIKSEDTEQEKKMMLGWKILSNITQVYGIVNSSNRRAPGQMLVARLISEESDRLIEDVMNSIENVPEEFRMMIQSVRSTGQEDDNKKTG